MKSILLIVTTEMQLVSCVASMLQDGNWDGCYKKLVIIQSKGRALERVAELLAKRSIFSEIVFLKIEELRRPKFFEWMRNPDNRKYWSFKDFLLGGRFKGERKFLKRVFCQDGQNERTYQTVYWHTPFREIRRVVEKVRQRKGESILVDEGTQSYLSFSDKKRAITDKIYLYFPEAACFSGRKEISIVRIEAFRRYPVRLLEILRNIFPREGKLKRGGDVVWVGQNFSSREEWKGAYDDLLREKTEKLLKVGKKLEVCEHPSRQRIIDLNGKGEIKIPFELEVLLGYRKKPKEIHTVNSSVGLFFPLMVGSGCDVKIYFYHFEFIKRCRIESEVWLELSLLLGKMKKLFPNSIFCPGDEI